MHRDVILEDDALLNIAYVMLSGHPLSLLLGGGAVYPQLVAITAGCSST